MVEILPIKLLQEEDSQIFGSINVSLAKLGRAGFPVALGLVVSAPSLVLQTTFKHYDFAKKEVFEQSLHLVKGELRRIPIPEKLYREIGKHRDFWLLGHQVKWINSLWIQLIENWVEEIRARLWKDGFSEGLTKDLQPQLVIFIKNVTAHGIAFIKPEDREVKIDILGGKLHPNDSKKLDELILEIDKKTIIPHIYEWVLDSGIKITSIRPYTPTIEPSFPRSDFSDNRPKESQPLKSAVKVLWNMSEGVITEAQLDGVYIDSERIFPPDPTQDAYENLLYRLTEVADTFSQKPVLFKLADWSEGMGGVRGAMRLLHQQNLLGSLTEVVGFARHKKNLTNIHLVIPFLRHTSELLQLKRELAVRKLTRKNSLQIWMEAAVPENIIELEDYLLIGVDGVVLNMDELLCHLRGFDKNREELVFYKSDVKCLIKFLDDPLKILHKSRIPFIAKGNIVLDADMIRFLIDKGVYGVVGEKHEAHSMTALLREVEKKIVLSRTS